MDVPCKAVRAHNSVSEACALCVKGEAALANRLDNPASLWRPGPTSGEPLAKRINTQASLASAQVFTVHLQENAEKLLQKPGGR